MAGIRVHISESLLDKYETRDLRVKVKAHFGDRKQGGGNIKEMHFPVLQYEAVIIFEESSVVDGVMRKEHNIDGKKLCIRRLPLCQIYRQLYTDLDPDMASIIQGCGIIDTLEHEIKLTMQYDKKRRTLIGFVGSWYQLETAWTLIDNLMVQQNRILLQNNLDELRYNSNIDGKGRPSRSAGLPSSDEDENLSLLIRPLEHEPRRIKQREEHDHSEDDHTALASKAVGREHVAEKSSASPSARQRKYERTSLLELTIDVDKAVWKEFPHDKLSSQQNQTRKKTKMVDEHDAPQSLLQDKLDMKSDNLKASSTGKEDISKSSIHQGGTDAVSAQMQHKMESDTHPNLPRHEELNGKQERGLVVGKDVGDKRYRMPIKQCLIDNTDDSDGTTSPDLHGQGFAFPDQSLTSGVETNAKDRDSTQNETFNHFASIKDESSVKRDGVQNGGGITNYKPVQDMDDFTEQDEDSVIGMPFQDEGLDITFSADCNNPQLEFMVGKVHVVVLRGDITKEKSEGIVSAASIFLDNHAGIAKAIATAAGNKLQRECKDFIKKHKGLDTMKVIHTSAGGHLNDKVTCVLHAVGPVWNENLSSDETFQYELTTSYINCFQYAEKRWLHSLSLPLLSSGIFGGQIHMCVRSFIDGLLIFIIRLGKNPHLQEIRLINIDLEETELTIVMLQQLLEMGLRKLTKEALKNCDNKYTQKTTTTRPKRSYSLPRSCKREPVPTTKDNYKEVETVTSTRGRTSSVSRKTNTSKLKETHSGQVTSSTSTQTNRSASETGMISGRSERDQDGSSFPTRTDRDGQSASVGIPFSSGHSLNSHNSTGSSSIRTRPASSTGVTLGKSERDQDGNGSSFPTRTGRDGQSASAGRPFSAGPRLKSKKSTGSSKSKTDSLDGGSVGHTKNPPQIKPSLVGQEPTAASKKKERSYLKKEIPAKAKSQPLKAVHDSQDSDSNMGSPRSSRGDNSDDSLDSPRAATGEKMFARRNLKPSEHILHSTQSLPSDLEKPPHKSNPSIASTLPLGLSQRHVEERDMDTVCPICLEMMHKPKTLPKCKHKFCSACIENYFKKCKPVCPQCGYVYGVIKGDQPKGGKMTNKVDKDLRVPGYEDAEGAVIITYDISGGKQELQHHEGMSSTVQTSVPKQDTVPVECQDENFKFSFCVGSIHVTVLCGDILRERSCGIVNAANGSLMHAAGVAGIIVRAAGPEMELECENFISMHGSLRTTEVMHTSAGGQFSREVTHILHAVGPIWIGETFKDKFYYELTKTFMNCLIYANDKLCLESLTLPLISSGIFGAPLDECVRCFLDGLLVYSKQETKTRHLKKVHLIFKDPDSTMLCIAILQQLLDNGIENLTKEALEMYSEHEIRNSEKARLLDSKDWTRYKYT